MTVRENLRFEKAMGLNYVGGCPQNRDRDNQLIGGTETWQLSIFAVLVVEMVILFIVPICEIKRCEVVSCFYIKENDGSNNSFDLQFKAWHQKGMFSTWAN